MTATTSTAILTDDLRDDVAHDIRAHTGNEDVCPKWGPYEPCRDCLRAVYVPAADVVIAAVRRATVLLHNGGPVAGDSGAGSSRGMERAPSRGSRRSTTLCGTMERRTSDAEITDEAP